MHSTSKLLIFFTTSFKYYFFISFYYFFVFIFFILSPSWSHCLSLPLFLNPAILLTASHQPPQFQRSDTHAELLANDPRQSPLNANAHAGQRPTNPRSHKIKSPRWNQNTKPRPMKSNHRTQTLSRRKTSQEEFPRSTFAALSAMIKWNHPSIFSSCAL